MRLHRKSIGGWLLVVLSVPATSLAVDKGYVPQVVGSAVTRKGDGGELSISLLCPRFVFDAGEVGGALPKSIKGSLAHGEGLEVSYAPQEIGSNGQLEVKVRLQWSGASSPRDWATRVLPVESYPHPILGVA